MNWEVRQAVVDDLEAIMVVENEVFHADAWSAQAMRGELESPHTLYLVVHSATAHEQAAPEKDSVVAYAGISLPDGALQADIQTIAVREPARRRGIALSLMNSLIAHAQNRGAEEIFLEVRADNPGAQQLYTFLRFEQIAVRERYYQPDGVAAHIMRLTLAEPSVTSEVGQ
jgi:ribosomal-protein-alanine acetyltransferase